MSGIAEEAARIGKHSDKIAEQAEIEADRRQIKISVKGAENLPSPFWVQADKHYVGQVLVNLIINSIRYGKEGGQTRVKFRDMLDKILIEVEDNGQGICFHVYIYNIQPGVEIDYATGESWLDRENAPSSSESTTMYVVNLSSEKFHEADCGSAEKLDDDNRMEFFGSREDLIAQGYEPCGSCKP